MTKGVRFIDGQEYLLCGRTSERDAAERQAKALKSSWSRVRIIKLNNWDFMIYVHAAIEKKERTREEIVRDYFVASGQSNSSPTLDTLKRIDREGF